MVRDLAEETVEGTAFDVFSASSMLGDNLGLCLIGLFKVPMIQDLAEETVDGSAFDVFSASSMLGDNLGLCLIGLFKVPMVRDLAEEAVDGSAFDDFRASSRLAIIGRQVGVMSNWFVQSPNDTRSCRRNSACISF